MAQQDKQDFYWNGMLAGAINNLYYDLINVDVVHVPYATTHRNSSFFLKTRPWYVSSESWNEWSATSWRDAVDVKIIRDEKCNQEEWTAYVLWKKWSNKAIFASRITDWCVWTFFNCTAWCTPTTTWDIYDECPDMETTSSCWDRKLFTTNYVRWLRSDWTELAQPTWATTVDNIGVLTWIQINKYTGWTTIWLFSDEYVDNETYEFTSTMFSPGNYLLVYQSWNWDEDWFAWQVRMITGKDEDGRVMVDSPWLWFKTLDTSTLVEWESRELKWYHVSYAVFSDWGEVLWFTAGNKIYILPYWWDCKAISPYNQYAWSNTAQIIWVADANDKIFVLTDNWFVHYCSEAGWYNKFFIQDDMFAWVDKTSIVAYRDMILAFGRKHIAVWVPDDQNRFYTMYNQSTSIWTRSRYSYAEYEWDLVFISNDKRLLRLWVSWTAWRYMLQQEDIWDMLNWKLATMLDSDEAFIWSDWNNLRVFVQTKSVPYVDSDYGIIDEADRNTEWNNTMTHIYKFDTLFKIWSEDHVQFLISWAAEWVYYWEDWLYVRRYSKNKYPNDPWCDVQWTDSHTKWPYTTRISAYLIENENNWLEWHPTLFQLAKLNRLITTLWPWVYSADAKTIITTYSKWIWYTYRFPINTDTEDDVSWVGLITDYYLWENLTNKEEEKLECMLSAVQDSQKEYQATCTDKKLHYHTEVQKTPWCDTYREFLIQDHWVCINDKLYELAPTMPLVTNLWENQDYSTQIKLELIWGQWDIICFGWRLAELYIAPIFMTGPDWEYQLQPKTDCE